jgi:hypothetical protein
MPNLAIESVKKHMGETSYCFSSKKLTLMAPLRLKNFRLSCPIGAVEARFFSVLREIPAPCR